MACGISPSFIENFEFVPEVCSGPKRLEAGFPPGRGSSTRIGAFDGWTKVAIIVSQCVFRGAQLARLYRGQGFSVLIARTSDGARLALADGIVPAVIVSDDLAFIAAVRSMEPQDAPKIPIHAVVQSTEQETVNAYMHGADLTVCVDAKVLENWLE